MKPTASRDFQVFAKPGGAACNLVCDYCYYLSKGELSAGRDDGPMSDDLLEAYVRQQIAASPTEAIRFFKRLGAQYLCLLPLVARRKGSAPGVSSDSVPPERFGRFLCTIFDEWKRFDIGRIQVEILEAAARTAFGRLPALCVFRPECGDVPVLEKSGDLYAYSAFFSHARPFIESLALLQAATVSSDT